MKCVTCKQTVKWTEPILYLGLDRGVHVDCWELFCAQDTTAQILIKKLRKSNDGDSSRD